MEKIMWDWIRAYKVSTYETFWGIQELKEYEVIYKKSLEEELEDILAKAGLTDDEISQEAIRQALFSVRKDISVHFGQSYYNLATMVGLYRMMLKKLAQTYGVAFPNKEVK